MVANDVIAATVQTIAPSAGALAVANNLRIASLSIAAYEYVFFLPLMVISSTFLVVMAYLRPSYFLTLPSEIRLYRTASRRR
jgi:hypothetical protein